MSLAGIITRLAESSSVSWEKPKKKRFRSRAVDDIGFRPSSVALVYASYASGVQIAIERGASCEVSGEAASTTPADSVARNLAGIVSRCLMSSVCSNVPRNAIKRFAPALSRGSHPEGSRVLFCRAEALNPGGWVGGALPPGFQLHAGPTVTHFLPQCNPTPITSPTWPHGRGRRAGISLSAGDPGRRGRPAAGGSGATAPAFPPDGRRLAAERAVRPGRVRALRRPAVARSAPFGVREPKPPGDRQLHH